MKINEYMIAQIYYRSLSLYYKHLNSASPNADFKHTKSIKNHPKQVND